MAAVMAAPEAVESPSSLLLLVVGGECGHPGLLAYVLEELERGRSPGAEGQGRWGGASGAGGSGARRAGVRVGCGVTGRNVPGRGPGSPRGPHVPGGRLDKTVAWVTGSGWGAAGWAPRGGGASDSRGTAFKERPETRVGTASLV